MIRSALLVAVTAGTLAAQSTFEGAISMTLTGDNGKGNDVAYMMKGGKVRMEMGGGRGGPAVMIFDMAEKKMLMLMADQKMYMEQSVAGAVDAAAAKGGTATIKKTGNTETIAGYKCEHVLVTDKGETSDVCTATGLGAFRMPGGGRGGPPKAESWESGVGDGGFPLKVTKAGKVVMEVTKIDKKALDASLFAPPADYQKLDMGAMMRKRP